MNFRIILKVFLGLSLGGAVEAHAQADRDRFRAPQTIPGASELLKSLHGSYSLSYMGPRINGTPEETYNIYLPDVSSVQLFHSLQLGYEVNDSLRIGIGVDIVQNLVDGIIGLEGKIHHRSSDWYDPYLNFELPHLIENETWSVFTGASFSLPIGPSSLVSEKITSVVFRQNWTLNHTYPWVFGFNLFFNPQFYWDPLPEGFQNRQTFYGSFSPRVGARFLENLGLDLSASFNVEHRSPSSDGPLSLGPALPDTAQLALNYSPEVKPLYVSVGTYFQSLLYAPSLDTSIIGAQFSVAF